MSWRVSIALWMGGMVLFLLVAGCQSALSDAVNGHAHVARQIKLGMEKDAVIDLLEPHQKALENIKRKPMSVYKNEGKLIEIYFSRSGWQRDGMTTDDEFTPYVFEDGKLTAIGWETLGGPKTQGKPRPMIGSREHIGRRH